MSKQVTLSEQESAEFYRKIQRLMVARQRLDELNLESKALRSFVKETGEELASFFVKKGLKKHNTNGCNLRPVVKTVKPKPTAENVFQAIKECYGNPKMEEQVRQHVMDKFVTPKQGSKTVLKIVKCKPKTANQPAPDSV